MPKPNPLTQGLSRHTRKSDSVPVELAPESESQPKVPKGVPTSRIGRVLIGGHFAPEVQVALKVLAAEERTSVQALIAEGINAVLARRHKPQIATLAIQVGVNRHV